jgi:hypothetical protein
MVNAVLAEITIDILSLLKDSNEASLDACILIQHRLKLLESF